MSDDIKFGLAVAAFILGPLGAILLLIVATEPGRVAAHEACNARGGLLIDGECQVPAAVQK